MRTLKALFVSLLLSLALASCGSYRNNQRHSGLAFRAFVSNPVHLGFGGSIFPALNIVDAAKDVQSPFVVSLLGAVSDAGLMVETPKRDRTLIFSPSNNALAIVNNGQESVFSSISLPARTESMVVSSDNTTLFVAVPNAPHPGQTAGALVVVNISSSAVTASIPVPGAHYLVASPTGNQILITSDSANSVSLVVPSLISSGNPPVTLSGFDKPVWAVYSADGLRAYVMNCGPECGGVSASISILDVSSNTPVVISQVPVAASTTGLLSGSTLYVAGTPPPASGSNCQASLCGVLTPLTVTSGGLNPSAPTPITDGYHNHMLMAPAGQLFVGSKACSSVVASGSAPSRGCLSVLNTATGMVYTSAQTGDVTGIEPILKRTVVYVCEGGALTIYDTSADLGTSPQNQLLGQKNQVTIVGEAVDVKLADF